jgi:hypothetical protein
MFNQLLPPRIDNTYHGHKLALWIFAIVVAVRITQSLAVIVDGYAIVSAADGVVVTIGPVREMLSRAGLLCL